MNLISKEYPLVRSLAHLLAHSSIQCRAMYPRSYMQGHPSLIMHVYAVVHLLQWHSFLLRSAYNVIIILRSHPWELGVQREEGFRHAAFVSTLPMICDPCPLQRELDITRFAINRAIHGYNTITNQHYSSKHAYHTTYMQACTHH